MDVVEWIRDAFSSRAVFGEVYEKNGVTVLPVASVRAGSAGRDAGAGPVGVDARPAGAFVIKDGTVTWMPAFDLNRVILVGQLVMLAAILSWRSVAKSRARRG